MTWRELPPLTTCVADQLPELNGVCLVAGVVSDHVAELWDEERAGISRAATRRAHEYSTGRYLAHHAMAELGLGPAAICRGGDRCPVWPADVTGSITHAGDLAVAAVAPANAVRGLGVDLELTDRLTARLHGKVFTAAERQRLAGGEPQLPAVMFSAKEAGYKAVYPKAGRYIGFHQAEVHVDWDARTLALTYLGDHEPNRLMEEGVGHFCLFERYVLTVFIIP